MVDKVTGSVYFPLPSTWSRPLHCALVAPIVAPSSYCAPVTTIWSFEEVEGAETVDQVLTGSGWAHSPWVSDQGGDLEA